MKLKALDLDIETGGIPVVIINIHDAKKYDLHTEDRVKVKYKGKEVKAIVDIALHNRTVKPGQIGMFDEVANVLKVKNGHYAVMELDDKPESLKYIKKKLDGEKLNSKEIESIVKDIVENHLSPVEMTYFVAACYSRAMSDEETITLTNAMVKTGEILKLKRHPILDKHCVGGVAGNRTTMILVPIIAAAGYTIPKTSSRSITSPAGTADTMEVLANVTLDIKKMKKIIMKTNGCLVWGGSLNLAPADDKIIRVERPLSIDAESQLVSSIMAKKLSVSSSHILIDIPVGEGAKIENMRQALNLKHEFAMIGEKLKKHITVIITDGSQPIGNGIGPALEARDVLWLLKRDKRAPKDLEKKSIMMAGRMLEMAGVSYGEEKAKELLDSGKAYKKMMEICKAQGSKALDPAKIKLGEFKHDVLSSKGGKVKALNNEIVSKIARIAGAPESPGAGMYLYKHKKDKVKRGEKLFTVYSCSEEKMSYVKDFLKKVKPYRIG